MSNLEPELQALRDTLLEMLALANSQLTKCRKAINKLDVDTAKDIIESEKRVNELELCIDRDCENILALYNPVATDLRFVISALKISNDLERIGDNAKGVAKVIINDLGKGS
jgi:phosphate transport system protein